MESKSPPLLPPPSTTPSATRAGGPKNSPRGATAAALVTFWVAQAEGGRAAGRQGAGSPGLISQGNIPRVAQWPSGSSVPPAQLAETMQKARGTRGEDAGTRAPPSPGVPPKRAKVGAGGGAGAGAPVFLRPLKDAAVSAGSDVQLRVVVSGTPQPSLSWFRDGQLLPAPAPEPSCLWLRSCGARDAGVYSCRAQNQRGQASCEAVLTVLQVGGNGEVGAKPGREGRPQVEKGYLGHTGEVPVHPAFFSHFWLLSCADPGVPIKRNVQGKGCQGREAPHRRSEVKGQHLVSKA